MLIGKRLEGCSSQSWFMFLVLCNGPNAFLITLSKIKTAVARCR